MSGGTDLEQFIERWKESGGSERSNFQLFIGELCRVLGVPKPDVYKPEVEQNTYVFERDVIFYNPDGSTSTGRIDLYKKGCFVLEGKQGSGGKQKELPLLLAPPKTKKGMAKRQTRSWDEAMLRAKGQADQYVHALPAEEGRPPFIVVVDVGYTIELFSEFSCSGGTYVPFPDAASHRITMDDLRDEAIRHRLSLVWADPLALDPSRRSAKVTREIADHLARLAKSLEATGNRPKDVAQFLMRCLFTMFAEDVGLLPKQGFSEMLEELKGKAGDFKPMAEDLWQKMKTGGYSAWLREEVLHFNGYLFAESWALELSEDQLALLTLAAKADWKDVEPAIFGTLLERALDPEERHKLGAHYTPRAYVERLVMPTIVEPLREKWEASRAAAVTRARKGEYNEAFKELDAFHRELCQVRVLDPACGSGNFLYVSLEHLKRLEGEVVQMIEDLAHRQEGLQMEAGRTVDPHQFLGLELNPRAAEIAQLVLWIGYLQWHFRTHGKATPPEPIIRNFKNIEERDAVLAYDRAEPVMDKDTAKPVTRWDGRTYKKSPVTGELVPDESARVLVYRYINPKKAKWPEADYVVGNPPFMGISGMRQAMGDGYTETIRKLYKDIPGSCDYVLYWWNLAAHLARQGKIKCFGFITTNSISQTFNRRIIEKHLSAKQPLSIIFAIPDHPWVDARDSAAVRIAMTVGQQGKLAGVVKNVVKEDKLPGGERNVKFLTKEGMILPDLTVGADVSGVKPLEAMLGLSCPGVKLHGSGFIVTPAQANKLGLGSVPGLEKHIRHYRNGKDLAQKVRGVMVIDLFGLEVDEARKKYPEAFQWVLDRVKPERDHNKRKIRRDNWWIFGEPISTFRPALNSVSRFIATPETTKYRFFVFLDGSILPDNMLINIALDDPYFLGVLSSKQHVNWALAQGGVLGPTPRYNKTRCFETFPFPDPSEETKDRIRQLGDQLDAHRKRQQERHPDLTMTGMYNVLEKLKAGEELTDKEREINDQGLVSVLWQIHQDLDAAVFEAYGWPTSLSDEEILERLVALNKERAAEEDKGIIRWLRPEFQSPQGSAQAQPGLEGLAAAPTGNAPQKRPWPSAMAEQAQAVRQALEALDAPATVEAVAKCFTRAPRAKVAELLETLAGLGQARLLENGRYTAY